MGNSMIWLASMAIAVPVPGGARVVPNERAVSGHTTGINERKTAPDVRGFPWFAGH